MPSSSDKRSPFEMLLNQSKGSNSDCDRPACEDTVSALTSALNRLNEKKEKNKKKEIAGSDGTKPKNVTCPPNKDRIGSSSWTLLHSMVSRRRYVSDF